MKKSDIIALLEKFVEAEHIVIGGNLVHAYELNPHAVCGGRQAYMPYFCVESPGHTFEKSTWIKVEALVFVPKKHKRFSIKFKTKCLTA